MHARALCVIYHERSHRCRPEWSPIKLLIEKAVTQAKIKCDMQVLHRCTALQLLSYFSDSSFFPIFVTPRLRSTKFNRSRKETEANILNFVRILVGKDILKDT